MKESTQDMLVSVAWSLGLGVFLAYVGVVIAPPQAASQSLERVGLYFIGVFATIAYVWARALHLKLVASREVKRVPAREYWSFALWGMVFGLAWPMFWFPWTVLGILGHLRLRAPEAPEAPDELPSEPSPRPGFFGWRFDEGVSD